MRSFFFRSAAQRLAFLSLLVTPAVACSLINSLDDVKAQLESDSGPGGDDGGDLDAADGSTGTPKGAIVIGGLAESDGGSEPVLTALAPEDGSELPLARKRMTVAGIQYDGARDLWYVFESGGATYFPLPTDPVTLHVMTLDTHTGAWATLQSLRVPTLESFTHATVLNERLVYVAYRSGGNTATDRDLITVNTSDPSNVVVTDRQELAAPVLGILGTRGASAGGTLNLLSYLTCGADAGAQCLQIQQLTVAANAAPTFGISKPYGEIFGSPGFAATANSGNLLAFKTPLGGTKADIRVFDPRTLTDIGDPIPFNSNDSYLKPMAIAECLGQALVIGTNQELSVYAVPLQAADGRQANARTQHSGQGVYFEPYTSTVLAPFSQSDSFDLTAMRLTGDKKNPALTLRQTDWKPAPIRPEIVATRTPVPFACPE